MIARTCAIAVSSVKGSEGNAASRSLPSTSLALLDFRTQLKHWQQTNPYLLTDSCLASLRAEVTNRPREGALLEAGPPMSSTMLGDTTSLQDREFRLEENGTVITCDQ